MLHAIWPTQPCDWSRTALDAQDTARCRWLRSDSAAGCWLACSCSRRRRATLNQRRRQVLVLQSFERGVQVARLPDRQSSRVDLDQRIGDPSTSSRSWSVRPGFIGAPEQAIVDYLRVDIRRSPPARPDRDIRRPCHGLCAQISARALSRHAASLRGRRSAIPARRAARGERDRGRGRERCSPAGRSRSCNCCPRPGSCSW